LKRKNQTKAIIANFLILIMILSVIPIVTGGPIGVQEDPVGIEPSIISTIVKVSDNSNIGEWVDETHVLVGDTIRFRITVTNQINYDMIDVHVESILTPSDILTYSGSLAWDFDNILASGEITIEFETAAVEETDVNGVICSTLVTADLDPKYVKDIELKRADLTIREVELQASILKLEDIQNNIDSLSAEKILLQEKYNQDLQLIETLKLDITDKEQIVADLKAYEESLNIKIVDQKAELDTAILKNKKTTSLLDQNQLDIDGLSADQLVLQDAKLQKIGERDVLEGQLKTALDEISAGNEDVNLLTAKIEEKNLEILAVDEQIQNNDLLLQSKLDEKTVLETEDTDETLAIESLKIDIEVDEGKLVDLQLQEGNLETIVALQKEDLNNLILTNEETNKQIDQTQINIDGLSAEKGVLEANNLNEIQTIDVLKNDILAAEASLADVQMKIDQTSLDLTDQQNKLVAEEATKQDIELKIIDLQDTINANELLLADTQQKVESTDIELTAQKSDLNNLILLNDQTKKDIVSTEETLNLLEADQLALQTKDADETSIIEASEADKASTELSLSDTDTRIAEVDAELTVQKARLAELEASYELTVSAIDANQEAIGSYSTEKSSLEQTKQDAEDELFTLESNYVASILNLDIAGIYTYFPAITSKTEEISLIEGQIEDTQSSINLLKSENVVLLNTEAEQKDEIDALKEAIAVNELFLTDLAAEKADYENDLLSIDDDLEYYVPQNAVTKQLLQENQDSIDITGADLLALQTKDADETLTIDGLKNDIAADELVLVDLTDQENLIGNDLDALKIELEGLILQDEESQLKIDVIKITILVDEGILNDLIQQDDALKTYINLKKADLSGVEADNEQTKQLLDLKQLEIDDSKVDLLALQTKDADETLTIDGLKTSIAADEATLADVKLEVDAINDGISLKSLDLNGKIVENDLTKQTLAQTLLDIDGLNAGKLALQDLKLERIGEKEALDTQLKTALGGIGEDSKNVKILAAKIEEKDLEILAVDEQMQNNDLLLQGKLNEKTALVEQDSLEKQLINDLLTSIDSDEKLLADAKEKEDLLKVVLVAQNEELNSKLFDADQTLITIQEKQVYIDGFIDDKNKEEQINFDLATTVDDIKKEIKVDEEYIEKINDDLLNLHDGMARVFVDPIPIVPLPPVVVVGLY